MNMNGNAYDYKPFTIEEFEREYLFGSDRSMSALTVKTRTSTGRTVRKKTRVKSRPRFITFLVIMIGLIVGGFGFLSGINESTASVTTDYASYTVAYGDTMWDIADEVNHSDTDTRKVVYAICQINDIQAGDLQPGMVLRVPTNL